MKLCSYYQAHILPQEAWFFVGVLRSFEHLCFDRTLNVKESIFEFFVPQDLEDSFIEIMKYFKKHGIVLELTKKPNRLADPSATI